MGRLRGWWRDWFRRRALDEELDAEIRYHLERDIEERIAAGESPAEARRHARAEFGAVAAIKEEVRETRATRHLESLWLDVRYGARALRRSPLFTLTAVVTLALTIGAVAALFTLAHAFFLSPLPVEDPYELVEVRATRDHGEPTGFVSYPDYLSFRDGTETLQTLAAAYLSSPLFVTFGEEADTMTGAVVTANFFPMLGLKPAVGRFFGPDEDAVPGRDAVVVLAHDLWRTRYGGDPGAIGEQLDINGVAFTIIGVAPQTFHGIGTARPQLYMPVMMLSVGYRWCSVLQEQDCTILRMFGRLADGVGIGVANAELAPLMPERWRDAPPGDNAGVVVLPLRGTDVGDTTVRFLALLGAVSGALLLVCCANLAGLLTGRAGARARELAIRTSLGAPRTRLIRQMLTESLLLAAAGSAAGVLLSLVLTRVLAAAFHVTDSSGQPVNVDLSLAPPVIGAVLVLTVVCALLFGVFPALASVRLGAAGPAGTLRRTATSVSGTARVARWLIGAQTAGAVAFVVIAALLAASAGRLLEGANYDPENVALVRLRPRLVEYEPARAQAYVRRVVERLAALPEVESVTMVGTGVAFWGLAAEVALPGAEDARLQVGYLEVGPGYFETLRTPLLRGRGIEPSDDRAAAPVAVVNETMAAMLWPEGGALGADIVVDGRRFTVVGVAADVALHRRDEAQRPYVHTAFWQNPEEIDARLQVRTRGDAAAALPRLLGEVSRVDPKVPISEPLTLEQRIGSYLRPQRMGAAAVSYAGLLAVLLSAMGLYAALAAAVRTRRQEIGVRMAVGASAADVFRMVVGQGGVTTAVGVAVGLGVAAAAARLLRHLLYGSATADVPMYLLAALVVTATGVLASVVPAARAARTEPARAMEPR